MIIIHCEDKSVCIYQCGIEYSWNAPIMIIDRVKISQCKYESAREQTTAEMHGIWLPQYIMEQHCRPNQNNDALYLIQNRT